MLDAALETESSSRSSSSSSNQQQSAKSHRKGSKGRGRGKVPVQQQGIHAVGWLGALLLRTAPNSAADVSARLLSCPALPQAVVVQLVHAGMAVTYAQLLAAADSMVAGVEVWVLAQQQLGITKDDTTAELEAVCCSGRGMRKKKLEEADIKYALTHGHTADLLQLAMNCSNHGTSSTVIQCLPATVAAAALNEPGVVRKLLLPTAARHHSAAVQHMAGLPWMQQHVDAATLKAALAQLLTAEHFEDVLVNLCWLPAAQQLSSEEVQQLLQAAVERGCAPAQLCELPAAAGITSDATLQLLQAAVSKGVNVEWLCELPAAAGISSEGVRQLLQAAVCEGEFEWYFTGLLRLPAAAGISSDAVSQLMLLGLEKDGEVEQLFALPAAAGISSEALPQLLLAALKHSREVAQLFALPAAAGLTSEAVLQLLQAAVEHGYVPEELCQLPAAAGISSAAVLQLLQAAVRKCGGKKQWLCGNASCIRLLCNLPAVHHLTCEEVFSLLSAAGDVSSKADSCEVTSNLLCGLPSMRLRQLSCQQVQQLLAAAVKVSCSINSCKFMGYGCSGCSGHLCRLPAAAGISSEALLELMQPALKAGRVPEELCKLPAAAGISSEALLQLLQATIKQGKLQPALFKLPAAAAVHKHRWQSLPAVRSIPAISQLTSEQVLLLLLAAVK
uniref:Uncharacterized protein n=1 Tax=Tetradesmus obliquus TaxID=3088 RepID=A0A383V6A8_TETOB|eukprot:jgi/Sobl393_1/13606/SZX60322.1